jgi:hypothetical protein
MSVSESMPASTSTHSQIQHPNIIQCLHPTPSTQHPNLPIYTTQPYVHAEGDIALDDGLGPSVGGDVEHEDGVVVLAASAAAVDDDVVVVDEGGTDAAELT